MKSSTHSSSLNIYTAKFFRRFPQLITFARFFYKLTRPRFTVGVVGIVRNDKNEYLLVEHVFHPRTPWGFPGGWLDRDEEPAKGVAREIQEELELTVEVGPLLLLERPFKDHLDIAYLCYTQHEVGKLSSELLSYRWHTLEDMPPLMAFQQKAFQNALNIASQVQWTSPSWHR